MQTLDILYFAWLRERVAAPRETIATAAATVADLVAELAARSPGHAAAFADRAAIRVALSVSMLIVVRNSRAVMRRPVSGVATRQRVFFDRSSITVTFEPLFASKASSLSPSAPRAVRNSTGERSPACCLSARHRARPSSPGRFTSSTTRSNACSCNRARAWPAV